MSDIRTSKITALSHNLASVSALLRTLQTAVGSNALTSKDFAALIGQCADRVDGIREDCRTWSKTTKQED